MRPKTRIRVRFWKSRLAATGVVGEPDTEKDYLEVLRGFPQEENQIRESMMNIAQAAARGAYGCSGATQAVFRPIAGLIWELLKVFNKSLEKYEGVRRQAERLGDAAARSSSSDPATHHTSLEGQVEQKLKSKTLLERLHNWLKPRKPKTYAGWFLLFSCGQQYVIDIGFDVEKQGDQVTITFWKFLQGGG
jgi:hypothetical protein